MADNRNQVSQKGNNGGNGHYNGNGNGNGQQEKKETPKERKLRLINEDSIWNVIKNKTPDTAEYVNLLNANDDMMTRLRMHNFERSTTLTYDDLKEFIRRNNEIKDLIHQLNFDLSKAVNFNYKPPRGFSAKPTKPQQQGQKTETKQNQPAPKVVQEMPPALA